MIDGWAGLEPHERPFREAAPFYAEYRYRPSEEFARLLATHLGWSVDDRVLDLGAGPAHVSTLLAPYAREVVVMEPEQAMLDEGRRRAVSAGLDNLSFVQGASDDLQRLKPSLGEFVAVVMSQSFHWMRDQDAVLRALDGMVDERRGAVALLGYVNEPEHNRVSAGLDREPWSEAEEILRRRLERVPEGPGPRGRHSPFPDILERSSFARVELGVSNYGAGRLARTVTRAERPPAVDQVHMSPLHYPAGLLVEAERLGVVVEAYSPLERGRAVDHPTVQAIAARIGRSPGQVALRWALQHGAVVIPKSARRERIRENAALFDFELGGEDMSALDALDAARGGG